MAAFKAIDTITARLGVQGVVIRKVTPGSSADRAGLKGLRSVGGGRIALGDIVTAVEGEEVRTLDDLLTILDRYAVGDQVKVEIEREGESRTMTLTLEAVE